MERTTAGVSIWSLQAQERILWNYARRLHSRAQYLAAAETWRRVRKVANRIAARR